MTLSSALVSPNLEEAVVLAIDDSGDSDSTGAIA
jgi:ADP-ribosylglycohydrolase